MARATPKTPAGDDRAQDPGELDALVRRLERFIHDPAADSFERLVRDVFRLQYRRVEPFRRLCESRGQAPVTLADWRDVPPVPVAAFQTLTLATAPAEEIFRSSGTTAGRRSVHHHPFPGLYRRVIDATFPGACLPVEEHQAKRPMLSLVPPRSQVGDSSLGFMVDHVLARWGDASSRVAFSPDGVDAALAGAWAAERQASGTPGTVLTTAFALDWWLEALEAAGERHRLPPGSTVFETGGFKGRSRELDRDRLLERLEERLGAPPTRVVREYGMTELTGHFYTDVLAGGDGDLFRVPHFMRVRALDPESLTRVPPGRAGLLAVLDLANVGSVLHVLTEDLGVVEGSSFRLLGRADDAALRGCSLTVDELRAC